FDKFARENLTVTRVDVGDFKLNIDGDQATIAFLGTIYFRSPNLAEEKSSADRFMVRMTKANGQWRGVPLPQPQSSTDDAPPPPPPPPPPTKMTVEAGKPLPWTRWGQDSNSVFALLREAVDASMRHDASFYERVLDEDYIETGPSGETLNKEQAIADVKNL